MSRENIEISNLAQSNEKLAATLLKEILPNIISRNQTGFDRLRTKLQLPSVDELLTKEAEDLWAYFSKIKKLTDDELKQYIEGQYDREQLAECILLIELAVKIAALREGMKLKLEKAPLNKFLQNVIPAFEGLYQALAAQLSKKEGEAKISHINFQHIAKYAIKEAEETLNVPDRDHKAVVAAARELDNNLFYEGVADDELARCLCILTCTVLCVAVCTAIGIAIGTLASGGLLVGLFPGGMLGSFVGVFLGMALGTMLYENYFYAPREFAGKQEKLGDKAVYQGVHNLNFKLYEWSQPPFSLWCSMFKSWRMTFPGFSPRFLSGRKVRIWRPKIFSSHKIFKIHVWCRSREAGGVARS
jgi:hypothetical protein